MKNHLTTKELAKLLGKTEKTIRTWRMNKIGPPYVRNGERGRCFYPRDQLGKWLMDQPLGL